MVTGVGIISPLGSGKTVFADALKNGEPRDDGQRELIAGDESWKQRKAS